MYDASRLAPVIRISIYLFATLFVLNSAFVLYTAYHPHWLPKQFFGVDFIADNYQRVMSAAAQYSNGDVNPERPLVAILGLSGASEGISIALLDGKVPRDPKYLPLCGGGRNIKEVSIYAAPLLNSGLQPDLVIFAISLFHLLDPHPDRKKFADNLRQIQLFQLPGEWFHSKRMDIKHAADAALLNIRITLFRLLENQKDQHTNSDPWREIVRMGLQQLTDQAMWDGRLKEYGNRGYYDATSYKKSAKQMELLSKTVKGFQEKGSRVVIVLMPEHSFLRNRIPAVALEMLIATLDTELGGRAPDLIDLRASVADSGFLDISHMNALGRDQFTPFLVKVVRENLR